MTLWLVVGIGFWLLSIFVALCLCRAAARGDKQLGYTPPSPILRYGALSRRRAIRAARRAGYVIDSQGRERLGLDHARHRR